MVSATELRALARVERNPRKRVRLLAIANVRDGMAVEVAARAGGMGRATLYRWLARERTGGPAALGDHPRSGRRRKLDAEQRAEVKAWVLAGPDVERDGVVAWRGGATRGPWSSAGSGSSWRCRAPIGCWASCTCRPWCRAPATATPTRRHRPPFSKLPGPREGDRRRLGTRHPGRGLVPRRDACRPEGHPDPGVGRDRLAPERAAVGRLPVGL